MIIQNLCKLYKQLSSQNLIPPPGYAEESIAFVLVLSKKGTLSLIDDVRSTIRMKQGEHQIDRKFHVPSGVVRTGNVVANPLWDHASYVLGQNPTKNQTRVQKCHSTFINKVIEMQKAVPDDSGVKAICNFITNSDEVRLVYRSPSVQSAILLAKKNVNFAFRLIGETDLISSSLGVRKWAELQLNGNEAPFGLCAVSGKHRSLAETHTPIRGVDPTDRMPLCSFHKTAFQSFGNNGRKASNNFPISKKSMFEYTTALNFLLGWNSKHKIQLGDTKIVYWASCDQVQLFDALIPLLHGGKPIAQCEEDARYSPASLRETEGKVHIVGLTPHPPSRIIPRFSITTTVPEIHAAVSKWSADTSVFTQNSIEAVSIFAACNSLRKYKTDKVAHRYLDALIPIIFHGSQMPTAVAKMILEHAKTTEAFVSHTHAGLLKLYLARELKSQPSAILDTSNKETGYLLGRLFAVLETQQTGTMNHQRQRAFRAKYLNNIIHRPTHTLEALTSRPHPELPQTYHQKTSGPVYGLHLSLTEEIAQIPTFLDHIQQCQFLLGYFLQKPHLSKLTSKKQSKGTHYE